MKCPGQDMQYWDENAIYEAACPECSKDVEFYKDDTTRKCSGCGHRFVNPRLDFGCAAYCQFAEQCLGTLPEEFVLTQESLLKDKVAVEVKRRFKNDFAGIGFATKIAGFAEKIGKMIHGADMASVLCSAHLLTAGAPAVSDESMRDSVEVLKDHSLRAAGEILAGLGAEEELIDSVSTIIEKVATSVSYEDDIATRVVSDAYHLALLDRYLKKGMLTGETYEQVAQKLFTEQAQLEAERMYERTPA